MTVICLCHCVVSKVRGQPVSCSFARLELPRGKERETEREKWNWLNSWHVAVMFLIQVQVIVCFLLFICFMFLYITWSKVWGQKMHWSTVTVEHLILAFNCALLGRPSAWFFGTWLQGFVIFDDEAWLAVHISLQPQRMRFTSSSCAVLSHQTLKVVF